jgi:hypothetical protein
MSDENDLFWVRRVLEDAGLRVQPVAATTTKRCDLRAQNEAEQYLVEVKGFHDDEAIGRALREGKLHQTVVSYEHRNAVEDGVEEAVKQLRETAGGSDGALRLAALLVRTTDNSNVTRQQILGAIYGKVSLTFPGAQSLQECLYFAESAFFRYRDLLDAALVIDHCGACLYLNDYGSRLDRMRRSGLGRFLAGHNALYDAERLENEGMLVADCDVPRRNERALIEYLEKKYNRKGLAPMGFKHFSATGFLGMRDDS